MGLLFWLPDLGSNQGPTDYNVFTLDYLITLGLAVRVSGASEVYCLDCSPSSLCTFPPKREKSRSFGGLGSGFFRCCSTRDLTFPEFTRFFLCRFPCRAAF